MDDERNRKPVRAGAARKDPIAPLWQELVVGAAVGMLVCPVFALALHAPASLMMLAVGLGLGAGAVIGLLLWVGSAPLPDAPVLPPGPGKRRGDDRWRR